MSPSCAEEFDARDTIGLYRDTCTRMQKVRDPLASVRAPARRLLKMTGRVAAYYAGDLGKVAQID